jgi:hypothetical protein
LKQVVDMLLNSLLQVGLIWEVPARPELGSLALTLVDGIKLGNKIFYAAVFTNQVLFESIADLVLLTTIFACQEITRMF